MKRLAIFVHYDKHDIVDEYVFYYLKELSKVTDDIVFVSTSSIADKVINKLNVICNNVIIRDNIGYDFMSYKVGLDSCELIEYDEVLICNDSVYGPVYELEELFNDMSKKECDFWGITESNQFAYHLQSYFILFKNQIIISNAFKDFWQNVCVLDSKDDIIFRYEIGLSQKLIKSNFKSASFVLNDIQHIDVYLKILKLIIKGNFKIAWNEFKNFSPFYDINCNITLWFWDKILITHKMPFIKVSALRDDFLGVKNLDCIKDLIQSISSYPFLLIQNHLDRVK